MCANCQLEPGDIEEPNRIAQQVSEKFSMCNIYPDYKVLVLTPQRPRVMRWEYMDEPIIQKVRRRFTLPDEKVLYLPAIYNNGMGKDGTICGRGELPCE